MPAIPRPDPEVELDFLAFAADLIRDHRDLDALLGPFLRGMNAKLRLERPTLSLLDPSSGEIRIEGAIDLTPAELRRGQWDLGEGITGEVAQTGKAQAVPRIASEPRFTDRTGARQLGERSFLCVPVAHNDRVVGTLSAFRPVSHPRALERDLRTMSTLAALLAPVARNQLQQREQAALESDDESRSRFQPRNLIGRSKPVRQVYELIAQVAPSNTTVLLRGESGTGKELVARALHEHSPRSNNPFVAVNCAALPESLVEAELFGHERGAFTGAHQQRKGRFELAQGGTLFLDEIGEISAHIQVKLLRVLQERVFERVGSARPVVSDVRVITATSRDLEAMIAIDNFRSDLYYRLNVFPIHLPPLRDRHTDILLLADHFIETFNRTHARSVRRISTAAIDMLMAYHWPGNVRELENCIERSVLLARNDVIQGHHLPPSLQTADESGTAGAGLQAQLDAVERNLILDALKSTRGNMARAARALEITERIMGLRVDKYGIDPRRFKRNPTSS